MKEGRIYHLRWFTPGGEIDFCGHATLGTSYVLLTFYEKEAEEIDFKTQVGILKVQRDGDTFVMNFPAYHCQPVAVTDDMKEAIGADITEAYLDRDLLLVLQDANTVINLKPDQSKVKNLDGLLVAVTARVMIVTAFPAFCAQGGSGGRSCNRKHSLHDYAILVQEAGKNHLSCFQASARTGKLYTGIDGDRVTIAGKAVLYSVGEILPEGINSSLPNANG